MTIALIKSWHPNNWQDVPTVNETYDTYLQEGVKLVRGKHQLESAYNFLVCDIDMEIGDCLDEVGIDIESGGDILQMLYDKINEYEDLLEQHFLDYCELQNKGPLCTELESILKENNIVRQAYHSNSFIGDHCHKYLSEKFIDCLTKGIIEKAETCFETYPDVINQTISISEKNRTVLEAYSKVHKLISHKKALHLTDVDLMEIESAISMYIDVYSSVYSEARIFPKQHLLEHHCLDWMSRWNFGMGFAGEQGGGTFTQFYAPHCAVFKGNFKRGRTSQIHHERNNCWKRPTITCPCAQN